MQIATLNNFFHLRLSIMDSYLLWIEYYYRIEREKPRKYNSKKL